MTGRVAATGLADELHERGYLILDGVDGRAHYVALPPDKDRAEFPKGSIVTAKTVDPRPADRNIEAVAVKGIYRTDRHLSSVKTRDRDPQALVQAHVRRLEALRRAGIVERIEEGVWRIPPDLAERGRQYDAQRAAGAVIEMRSELTLQEQIHAKGVTWLDRELVARRESLGPKGFGSEVHEALAQRE